MYNSKEAYIGVDLGGTSIKCGAIEVAGNILIDNKRPTESGISAEHILGNITASINDTRKVVEADGYKVKAVGIGSPGVIDITTGKVLGEADNLSEWNGLNLAEAISNTVDLPVFVDNDANLMGLGEFRFGGDYSDTGNIVFLTIGTGIGGAIFINGELYRGANFAAGELGGQIIQLEGETGFWEDFASTSAMVHTFRNELERLGVSSEGVDGKYIYRRYVDKNALAVRIFEEHTRRVGMGVATLVNIFNPEGVIVGGGISESGDEYFNLIRKSTSQYSMPACFAGVKILPARLGNKAGFMGAAHYAYLRIKKAPDLIIRG